MIPRTQARISGVLSDQLDSEPRFTINPRAGLLLRRDEVYRYLSRVRTIGTPCGLLFLGIAEISRRAFRNCSRPVDGCPEGTGVSSPSELNARQTANK